VAGLICVSRRVYEMRAPRTGYPIMEAAAGASGIFSRSPIRFW